MLGEHRLLMESVSKYLLWVLVVQQFLDESERRQIRKIRVNIGKSFLLGMGNICRYIVTLNFLLSHGLLNFKYYHQDITKCLCFFQHYVKISQHFSNKCLHSVRKTFRFKINRYYSNTIQYSGEKFLRFRFCGYAN